MAAKMAGERVDMLVSLPAELLVGYLESNTAALMADMLVLNSAALMADQSDQKMAV